MFSRLWLAVLPLIMLLCGWYRWSGGLHFQEVFVRPGEAFSEPGFTVYGVVSSGGLQRLQRAEAVERLWVFPFVRGVRAFVVAGPGVVSRDAEFRGDVGVGASWPDAVRLRIAEERLVTSEDPELGDSLRRLGISSGLLVRPAGVSGSGLSSLSELTNWGGDWNFLWVSMLQGLLIWLSLSAVLWGVIRLSAARGAVTESAGSWKGWRSLPAQMLRALLLVMLVHQSWVAIQSLLWVRSPAGFLWGMMLFLLLMCFYILWLRWIWLSQSGRGIILRMLAVGLLLLLAKVYWLSTVEYRPSSDYLMFHRFGQQMAAEDWEGISATKRPNALVYICRAWCYSYPVSALFGAEITTFEYVNAALQVMSVVVFCLLVTRVSGLKTAACCMPLVVIYSEFWYTTGMVAPNVAACLWIPLTWLLVDVFDRSLSDPLGSEVAGVVKSAVLALSLGVGAGVCIGTVELLKGYSAFFLLSLLLFIVFRRWFSDPGVIPRLFARALFLLVTVVTFRAYVSGITTELSEKSGMVPADLNLRLMHLAYLETDSTALGRSLHHWIHGFFLNVPESRRRDLQVRKILHEQLVGGMNVYSQVLLKNRVMAHPTNAMAQVLDETSPVSFGRSLIYAPRAALQVTLAWQISLSLFLAGTLRVLMARGCPLQAGEVFPLLSAVTTLAAACLLTEGHPYTGQNSAFPLFWTAGILGQRLMGSDLVARVSDGRRPGLLETIAPARLLIAFVLWSGIAALHVGLGEVIEAAGLTFHRITPAAHSAEQTRGLSEREVELVQSRVHAGLRLVPQDGHLRAGDLAERQFVVESLRPLTGVRFFITGNVRRFVPTDQPNYRAVLAAGWKGLPIEYEVLLGGQLVSRGRLENLAFSRFVECPAEFWQDSAQKQSGFQKSVVVTLRLRCRSDVSLRNSVWPPSLTVEFFH
ncbi:MAG: hypothetical protein ACKO2P_20060 [Planctomycetota bacterium]